MKFLALAIGLLSISSSVFAKNEVYCEHSRARDGTTTKHIITDNMTQYFGSSRLDVRAADDRMFSMNFDVLENDGEKPKYVTKKIINLDVNSGFLGVSRDDLSDSGYYTEVLNQEYVTFIGEKEKLVCRSHFRPIDKPNTQLEQKSNASEGGDASTALGAL